MFVVIRLLTIVFACACDILQSPQSKLVRVVQASKPVIAVRPVFEEQAKRCNVFAEFMISNADKEQLSQSKIVRVVQASRPVIAVRPVFEKQVKLRNVFAIGVISNADKNSYCIQNNAVKYSLKDL